MTGPAHAGPGPAGPAPADQVDTDQVDTDQEGQDSPADDLRIVGGSPSDDEIAAITAVLHDLATGGDEHPVLEVVKESAWQRDRRPVRDAISRGPGEWRGFR